MIPWTIPSWSAVWQFEYSSDWVWSLPCYSLCLHLALCWMATHLLICSDYGWSSVSWVTCSNLPDGSCKSLICAALSSRVSCHRACWSMKNPDHPTWIHFGMWCCEAHSPHALSLSWNHGLPASPRCPDPVTQSVSFTGSVVGVPGCTQSCRKGPDWSFGCCCWWWCHHLKHQAIASNSCHCLSEGVHSQYSCCVIWGYQRRLAIVVLTRLGFWWVLSWVWLWQSLTHCWQRYCSCLLCQCQHWTFYFERLSLLCWAVVNC